MSPGAFKNYWESKHIPLLQSLSGPNFPEKHIRHYLARNTSDPSDPDAPITLVGNPEDLNWDAYAEITFDSEARFKEFLPVMSSQEVQNDEKRFTEPEKMRAVVVDSVMNT